MSLQDSMSFAFLTLYLLPWATLSRHLVLTPHSSPLWLSSRTWENYSDQFLPPGCSKHLTLNVQNETPLSLRAYPPFFSHRLLMQLRPNLWPSSPDFWLALWPPCDSDDDKLGCLASHPTLQSVFSVCPRGLLKIGLCTPLSISSLYPTKPPNSPFSFREKLNSPTTQC